jgi:hypothetical protein
MGLSVALLSLALAVAAPPGEPQPGAAEQAAALVQKLGSPRFEDR